MNFGIFDRFKKYFILKNYSYKFKRLLKALRGDVFSNPGPITEGDFEQIKTGIDEVNPKIFIEIGTGSGVSGKRIYRYLRDNYPQCHFYTMELFKDYYDNIKIQFQNCSTFHAIFGLSVRREDTTNPAYAELAYYSGPTDVLRNLIGNELNNRKVDIAFVDSRKGTALAEFLFLKEHISTDGVIFCHDVLNGGKGVEVLEYLKKHEDEFVYEVIATGEQGMIKIKLKDKLEP